METKQPSEVHSLSGDGWGRAMSEHGKKRVSNHETRGEEKSDRILVVKSFQLQMRIQTMIFQLTQNDGKVAIHVFITASVLPFSSSKY